MLHKHPSAEQAQIYFGITEPVKKASSLFSKYLEKDIKHIYNVSIYQALKDHYDVSHLKDLHIAHIQKLLIGAIDDTFMKQSATLWGHFNKQGVTIGEYIKLYQLLMSYFSAEAHKKYWFRYAKYRELNRSIRNLMLFDLAAGTSGPVEHTLRFVSDDEDFSTLSLDIAHARSEGSQDLLKEVQNLTLRSAFLAKQIEASVAGKQNTDHLEDHAQELVLVTRRLKEINGLFNNTRRPQKDSTIANDLSKELL